ncbi:hypothetical protein BB028_08850 [Neisseria gonorrhoeae]|nr:hypothetical protein BB028_08850 [Neisseria gonorrhoeae]
MHLPFTGAGQVRGNTRTVIPDNTVTLKPAIPAQAGIRICRDSLKSGGGGMVLQINDVDTNSGEFAIYTAQDASVKLDLLKMELKHCKEMLEQKTKKSSCSAS